MSKHTSKRRRKLAPPPQTTGLSGAPYCVLSVEALDHVAHRRMGRNCFTRREAEEVADYLTTQGETVVVLCEVEDVAAPWDRKRKVASETAHTGRS